MKKNELKINKLKIFFVPLLFFLIILFFLPVFSAKATVIVAPATGGSAISADNVGGAYTTLLGPIMSEQQTADIKKGTIILNAPTGFIFDITGTAPTVLVTRIAGTGPNSRNTNGLASGSTIPVTRTLTQLTVTISSPTSGQVKNSLTWQNIRVRPSLGTPLVFGNIFKTGTSSISGITNSITNLGTLKEVHGAKNKLAYIVQPSPLVTVNSDFTTNPFVALQDKFGNIVTSDNATVINYSAVLSTEACGGQAGLGTLTSIPLSGSAVISGLKVYTSMHYSFGEIIKICVSSPGVTSALSNAVTVNNTLPQTISITPASKTLGDSNFTLTISGSGFVSNSIVSFNGVPVFTTFVSVTELTALIPDSLISSTGEFNVVVINPAPGGGTSNIKIFTVTGAYNTSKFVLNDPGNMNINSRLKYTVERRNESNTITTFGTDIIYLHSSSTGPNKNFYNAATSVNAINSITILPGSSSVDFWYKDDEIGNFEITVSDKAIPDGDEGIDDHKDTVSIDILPIENNLMTVELAITATRTDLNGDGLKDFHDVNIFIFYWLYGSPLNMAIDFNNDLKVDSQDILLFVQYYNNG